MDLLTKQVTIRKLMASEGKLITDKQTQTLRSKMVYLGSEDSENNYIEIDENIQLDNSFEEIN